MKFEICYQDASKVVVDVPDAEVRAWLDGRAKRHAQVATDKAEEARGPATSAKVI